MEICVTMTAALGAASFIKVRRRGPRAIRACVSRSLWAMLLPGRSWIAEDFVGGHSPVLLIWSRDLDRLRLRLGVLLHCDHLCLSRCGGLGCRFPAIDGENLAGRELRPVGFEKDFVQACRHAGAEDLP